MLSFKVGPKRLRFLQGLFIALVSIWIVIVLARGETFLAAVFRGAFMGGISFILSVIIIVFYFGLRSFFGPDS